GTDKALQIPDLVAKDLHAHGGAGELPCSQCGKAPATAVGLSQGAYLPFCDACWQKLPGRLTRASWKKVLPLLFVLPVLGMAGWGVLQQDKPGGGLLLLLPFAYGLAASAVVLATGTRVTLGLRVGLFAFILLVVLAGNYWGFQAGLPRKGPHVD